MTHQTEATIKIPGGPDLPLLLRPEIAALREAALREQGSVIRHFAAQPILDARAWSEREDGEDWLVWRARRTVARLTGMPIDLSPGERDRKSVV